MPRLGSAQGRFGLGSDSLGLASAQLGLGWRSPQFGPAQPGLTKARLALGRLGSSRAGSAQFFASYAIPRFSLIENVFCCPLRAAPTY